MQGAKFYILPLRDFPWRIPCGMFTLHSFRLPSGSNLRRVAILCKQGQQMKTLIVIFMAAITSALGFDEPQSTLAICAREAYEKAFTAADAERATTFQLAKDEALARLESVFDKSMQDKNRSEANTIAAAIKSIKERSVIEKTGLPAVDEAKENYERTVMDARKHHQSRVCPAKKDYVAALEAASDAAFEEKDLDEVNRIAAVLDPLKAELAPEGPVATTFMGVSASGESLVYVIDTSSSMSGGRLKVAQSELKKSLRLLQPNKQFGVIFYNEHRTPLMLPREGDRVMHFATEFNKLAASHNIDRVRSDAGTEHKAALLEALRLKPDVIYFLTDGDEPELSPADLREIAKQRGNTTIHVINVGDNAVESRQMSWLKKLAAQSNGEYHPIKAE
jgi:Mg-chelatase subunit ChlD